MGRAERRQAEREQRRTERRSPGIVNPLAGGQHAQPLLTSTTSRRQLPVQDSTPRLPRQVPTSMTAASPPVTQIVTDPPKATSGNPPTIKRTRSSFGDSVRAAPLEVTSFGCEILADVEPQALGLTYWFDVEPDGEPRPVTIRVHRPPHRPGRRERCHHLHSRSRRAAGSSGRWPDRCHDPGPRHRGRELGSACHAPDGWT